MNIFLIIIGWLCVALGTAGIFLPLLPTTPFLLLASYLFFRSSPKARNWLLNHKHLGVYIKNYQEDKAIPLKSKIISIFTLWATISFSIYLVREKLPLVILLLIIATAVTIHISRFKTKK